MKMPLFLEKRVDLLEKNCDLYILHSNMHEICKNKKDLKKAIVNELRYKSFQKLKVSSVFNGKILELVDIYGKNDWNKINQEKLENIN